MKPLVLICSILMIAGCSDSSSSPEDTTTLTALRVMSYNLRYASSDTTAWALRRPVVVGAINDVKPDLLGVQEADELWMEALPGLLTDYAYVGVGRDDGVAAGEFSAIFYLKEKYEVFDSGTFWLSEIPDEPSFGWGANNRRICTYAYIMDRATGEVFVHFNTHLDHESEPARVNGTALILETINSSPYPVILTGDFNFPEGTATYQTITSSGLADTKHAAATTMDHGTINFFAPNSPDFGLVIDFIFAQEDAFDVSTYQVLTSYEFDDNGERIPASDHYPVVADLLLK